MASLLVLYRTPADPTAFDDYYFGTHVAIAKRMPGLQRYAVSEGAVAGPDGASDVHLVATLTFASMAEVQAALASPEGQAAAGDLANFAQAGVDLYMFDDTTL